MAFRGHKTAGQSVEHALHVSQARKGLNAMPNVLLQRAAVVGGMTKLLTLFFLVGRCFVVDDMYELLRRHIYASVHGRLYHSTRRRQLARPTPFVQYVAVAGLGCLRL